MSSKWYPSINTIIDDSIIVFDTSVLLNVYRYSLISSKRILNHLRDSEEKVWLPNQVKEEFYKNRDNVRNFNLYNKLDVNLNKHVKHQKDKLLVQLSEYEKKRFSNFDGLKDRLEKKFTEMGEIIEEYKNEIADETDVYKEFIKEADEFLESILNTKVGEKLGFIELMEILKEGELRYKYNLPPGYEDAKTKEGVDKFGDLIMWKEIIKNTERIPKKHVVFVTSDTKADWFRKKQNLVVSPREELISEFKHYHPEKELILIPFDNYIEEISGLADMSDKELLLELRMNGLINSLSLESCEKIVDDNTLSVDRVDLRDKALKNSTKMTRRYLNTALEIVGPNIESITVQPKGIQVIENEVIYSVNIIAECDYPTISYLPGVESHGSIHTDIIVGVELKRRLEDNEDSFINNFKENPLAVSNVVHVITDNENYAWGNDFTIEEEYYSTCGNCGKGMNILNDAGDGFCTECSE